MSEHMRQTYNHAGVQIYHGDCRELVLAEPADVMISDPPYSEKTHKGARTTVPGGPKGGVVQVTFPSMTVEDIRGRLEALAPMVKTWCVMTCDFDHAIAIKANPPVGWEFVRAGVWVKPDGTPQMTGDRPGTGWEAIAFLHRTKPDGKPMKKRWNGGGRNSVFTHGVCRDAMYPTQKPVALVSEFVRLFTQPGDTILDPFCGSGTTLYAAKELRRKAIGCDVSDEACALAEKRLAQDLLPMGEGWK